MLVNQAILQNMESRRRTITVDADLECSICKNEYTDPRLLPCMHTFCVECLDTYFKTKLDMAQSITCPLCRCEIQPPQKGANDLPINSFLQSVTVFKSKKSPGTCDRCKLEQVSFDFYCTPCHVKLCSGCVQSHYEERTVTKHEIVKREQLSEQQLEDIIKRPRSCTLHSETNFTLYCMTCKKAICVVCRATDHHVSHSCEALEQWRLVVEKELYSRVLDIKTNLALIHMKIAMVETDIEQQNERITNMMDEIDRLSKEIIERIKDDQRKLKEELQLTRDQINADRNKFKVELQFCAEQLQAFVNQFECLASLWSNIDVVNMSEEMGRRADNLVQMSLPEFHGVEGVSWESSGRILTLSQNVIGRVKMHQGMPVFPANYCSLEVTQGNIAGLATFDNFIFVINSNSSQIEAFSADVINSVETIEVRGLLEPSDITTNSLFGGAIFVTDWNDKLFRVSTTEDKSKSLLKKLDNLTLKKRPEGRRIKSWTVEGNPIGVSVNESGNLVVACQRDNTIKVISPSGIKIESIHLPAAVHSPSHIIQFRDHFFVCGKAFSVEQESVCLVSKSSEMMIQCCYVPGSDERQLNNPTHLLAISIGGNKRILVADQCNDRILLLDEDLQLVTILPTGNKLKTPTRICYNATLKRLYVSEKQKLIRIYQL